MPRADCIVFWNTPQDDPDDWTQGETLDKPKSHLRDLYVDLTSGEIPSVRRIDEIAV